MDFKDRLEKAVERGGQRLGETRHRAKLEKSWAEEELKRLHSQYRLELSERIENCLRQIPAYFPGFRYESVVGDRGWGRRSAATICISIPAGGPTISAGWN